MIQEVLIVRATRLIAQDEAFDKPVEGRKTEKRKHCDGLRRDKTNDNQCKSFIHIIQILSYLRIVSAACLRCLALLRPLTPLHHDWMTITAE